MNIIILGAAGFIGTNIALKLLENKNDKITLVDTDKKYFCAFDYNKYENINIVETPFDKKTDFNKLIKGQDVVYHLFSTIIPTNSNLHIPYEFESNIVPTLHMLDSCAENFVKKIVFISSGGTVYGKESNCPLSEEMALKPITSYGIQKATIERLLYLYKYMYGLDYRIIRLSNPYGPYQRPNGQLGAVTTFIYKALKNEDIIVYGDGSVKRDFIYIDDVVKAIMNIVNGNSKHRTFNLGCGYGTSIKQLIQIIEFALNVKVNVKYTKPRKVDVPINFLDISRYENEYGKLKPLKLDMGIRKTACFIKDKYQI